MPPRKFEAIGVLFLAFVGCVVCGALAWAIPEPPSKPLFDAYRIHNAGHLGEVLKIDPKHRFENGTVQEGWLVRRFGTETWMPRPKKDVELVRR